MTVTNDNFGGGGGINIPGGGGTPDLNNVVTPRFKIRLENITSTSADVMYTYGQALTLPDDGSGVIPANNIADISSFEIDFQDITISSVSNTADNPLVANGTVSFDTSLIGRVAFVGGANLGNNNAFKTTNDSDESDVWERLFTMNFTIGSTAASPDEIVITHFDSDRYWGASVIEVTEDTPYLIEDNSLSVNHYANGYTTPGGNTGASYYPSPGDWSATMGQSVGSIQWSVKDSTNQPYEDASGHPYEGTINKPNIDATGDWTADIGQEHGGLVIVLNGTYNLLVQGFDRSGASLGSISQWSLQRTITTADTVHDQQPNQAPVVSALDPDTVTVEYGDPANSYSEPGLVITDADGDSTSWTYTVLQDANGNTLANGHQSVVDALADIHNSPVGTYSVYYLATDGDSTKDVVAGPRYVIVQDSESPVITLSGAVDQTILVGDTWSEGSDGGYTATDNVDGDLTSAVSVNGYIDTNTAGTYLITYDVSDSSGNAAPQRTRRVIVETPVTDTVPNITLNGPSSVSYEAGELYIELGASYSDAEDSNSELNYQVTGGVSTDGSGLLVPGTYTITYTVTDTDNNSASVTRTVVVDQPVDLTLSANVTMDSSNVPSVTVTWGANVADYYFTLTADADGAEYFGTLNNDTTGDSSPHTVVSTNNLPAGDYSWVITGTGDSGQSISGNTGTLTVQDDAPVITITGNHTYNMPLMWEMGDVWTDPGVSATDAEDGTVPVTTDASGLNVTQPGTYYVNYSATDSSNNTTTAQRVVVVCDNAAPTLTVNGDANPTITQSNDTYMDAGATAMDGGGDISDQIQVSGDVVILDTPGTYVVEYNVSDASGNAAPTAYRTVTVVAAVPTVTLIGDMMVHVEVYGGTWSDPGATATDHDGADLTTSIVTDDTVQEGVAGQYNVTYSVTNGFGNTGTATRMVHVGAHMCPVVEDLSVPAGSPNMAGLALVANDTINYNGVSVDVSGYTTGNWASLAANVGLSAEFVTGSRLDVQATTGRSIEDSSFWSSLKISDTEIGILDWVAGRTFAEGISTNRDGSSANVAETVIKFVSYQAGRQMDHDRSMATFARLSDPVLSYPFDFHCALDSGFAVQDVTLIASDKVGKVALSDETGFPLDFVEYRLTELLNRGIIDYHDFYRKLFGADLAGLTKSNGEKRSAKEIKDESPETHQRLLDASTATPTESKTQAVLNYGSATAGTVGDSSVVLDRVHNLTSMTDPTVRTRRRPPELPKLSTDVATVVNFEEKSLIFGLDSYLGDEHLTAEFLGGLYSGESAKQSPRANVLAKVTQLATDAGVDISGYQGQASGGN